MRHGKLVVVAAIVAFVGATLAWLARDQRARQVAFGEYSVHDTSDEGLSVARGYLLARGAEVRTLTRPVLQSDMPPDGVLLRVGPRLNFGDTFRDVVQEAPPPRKDGKKGSRKRATGGDDAQRAREDRAMRDLERRQEALRRAVDDVFGTDEKDETAPGEEDAGGSEDDAEDDGTVSSSMPSAMVPSVTLLDPAEDAWVSGGGRLVLAIDRGWGPLSVRAEKSALVKVHPSWPGVGDLRQVPARVLEGRGLADGHAIFARGDAPVAHRIPRGRGDIVVLSCPDVLRNDRIDVGDHLALLETLAGGGRTVLFDERSHGGGTEAGLLELLRRWGLGPLLLLGALAGVIAFWRGVARIGPPADDHREVRTEAVDFVGSVAVLYGRALTREDGLALYRRDLERQVALRTDLRDDALRARIRALLDGTPGEPGAKGDATKGGAAFARRLRQLNDAFGRLDTHHAHRP